MEKYEIFSSAEYEKAEKAKEAEKSLEKFFSEIDLDKIHSLITSFAKSAGVDEVNLINKSDVFTAYDEPGFDKNFAGTYSSNNNKVHINTEGFKKFSESKQSYAFLHVFIHENTHAMSRISCDGVQDEISDFGYRREAKTLYDGSAQTLSLLDYFDEAVTETIARKLTLQYIDSDKRREEFMPFANEQEKLPYNDYVVFLDQFTKRVAEKTGTSPEVVWEGIALGYLKGDNLFDPEIEKAMEEVFYEGIIYDIGLIDNPEDLNKVLLSMDKGDSKGILEKIIYKVKRKINGV